MKITSRRFEPGLKGAYESVFRIENEIVQGMTIMDLLCFISENMDPTLTFFQHSACGHGICKRCAVRANGRTVLACTAIVDHSQDLHLAPAGDRQPVRDLVVH